ncbi:MAG TPA: glutamate-5-semialdehyde dehydrogenase [Pyrinomonadaceae bacterium]|nr:glutamate-5-semialdehyde dehydrogenase [Pyrinomonadaceae bacterium]
MTAAIDDNRIGPIRGRQADRILAALAELLDEHRLAIVEANRTDLNACPPGDHVIFDRLKVDNKKIDAMIDSVRGVKSRESRIGEVIYSAARPDGLRIENRRVPFGTILIIFEARPDVCIEAASIALKAGNRILLKGGREARNTNLFLAGLWQKSLEAMGSDAAFVRYLDISREDTQRLIAGETERFDLVIPRGGEALIDFALKNSKAPVLVSGRGNNFLYIDRDADLEMALKIGLDGKSRLSVCNALDKVLFDKGLLGLEAFIGDLAAAYRNTGIHVFGDELVQAADPSIKAIESEDVWYEEFLSAKIVFGLVDGLDKAIAKINKYSGGHSASIVTKNQANAARFMHEVDSAAVYHNASTRFTDGGEFGLGAEIAISTQKLHFRGPLGAEHLLTNKWFVHGDGQVRG